MAARRGVMTGKIAARIVVAVLLSAAASGYALSKDFGRRQENLGTAKGRNAAPGASQTVTVGASQAGSKRKGTVDRKETITIHGTHSAAAAKAGTLIGGAIGGMAVDDNRDAASSGRTGMRGKLGAGAKKSRPGGVMHQDSWRSKR